MDTRAVESVFSSLSSCFGADPREGESAADAEKRDAETAKAAAIDAGFTMARVYPIRSTVDAERAIIGYGLAPS